jgi:hypothetical protein
LARLSLACQADARPASHACWYASLDAVPIYFQQALCAMESFFQAKVHFVLYISSAPWAGRSGAAAAFTASARLAKDIGEEVGIRRSVSE